MPSSRLRFALPIIHGVLAAALIVWDIHNTHVIESMGMDWDTGAPIWPYQTSAILLLAIDFPAYLLAVPLCWILRVNAASDRYWVIFPAILVLWTLIGNLSDRGLPNSFRRHPALSVSLLLLISVTSLFFALAVALDEARWWFEYGTTLFNAQAILLLRAGGIVVWCVTASLSATVAAFRLYKSSRIASA